MQNTTCSMDKLKNPMTTVTQAPKRLHAF